MKKRWGTLVSLALIVAMLAGCGGTDSKDGKDNPSGAGEVTQGSADGAEKESIVRMGVSGTPDLDPAIATTTSSLVAVANMYDTLIFPTEDGPIPRVAESWEVSEDGLTYTFKLKTGIKFHNGSELKASDVVFSMNRLLAIGEGYAYLFTDFVDSSEATSDDTVVFHLKKPFGPFINALVRLYIVSEEQVMANKQDGSYGEFGDYGKAYMVTHDAGSGAYQAVELVQQDYFYAEKFPDWFVGFKSEKVPEAFKLCSISEASTVRTMVNNKELEITDPWQSTENLTAMSKMEGVSIAEFSTNLLDNMQINTQLAPMDDVNFRRAICSLIDYETICNTIFVNSKISQGPVPATIQGHTKTNTYSFDVEKAKEYLAASKYADSYQDYKVEILCNADVPDMEKIALMLQAAAAQIGIKVEISKAPWVSIIDRVGAAETTPHMTIINSAPSYDEAGNYLESRYHSKTMGTWEQGEWLGNAEVDKMIEDSLATVDQTERFQKYAEIQNYIVDELCPTAYLCDRTERVIYQSSYLTWDKIENVASGEIANSLVGYMQLFSDMELHLDKK